jgi:RimJ/RimL family protein N-acetyltransferase
VLHTYRLDHADLFLAQDEHLHVNEAVGDGRRSLSLVLCHYDRVIGGFVLNPKDKVGVRELGFWLARPYWG